MNGGEFSGGPGLDLGAFTLVAWVGFNALSRSKILQVGGTAKSGGGGEEVDGGKYLGGKLGIS